MKRAYNHKLKRSAISNSNNNCYNSNIINMGPAAKSNTIQSVWVDKAKLLTTHDILNIKLINGCCFHSWSAENACL